LQNISQTLLDHGKPAFDGDVNALLHWLTARLKAEAIGSQSSCERLMASFTANAINESILICLNLSRLGNGKTSVA
jgi:hypothetical protein